MHGVQMRKLLFLILFCASVAHAQFPYSSILSTSRVPPNGWVTRGLPATMPSGGGTTPNPWTPPSASWPICTSGQAGTTIPIPSGASAATINGAIASCGAAVPTGSVITLACGTSASPATYTTGAEIRLSDTSGGTSHNNTVLRGACGADYSKIILTSGGTIDYADAWSSGAGPWTAGFSQGATSLTLGTLTSGSIFSVGQIIELQMCNSGFTGVGCTTGAISDGGGLFNCSSSTACALQTTIASQQSQTVIVTSVSGGPPYTVGFTPPLDMSNWSSTGGGATVTWIGSGSVNSPSGIGLENVTVDETALYAASQNFGIQFTFTKNSWMTGVRVVGAGAAQAVQFENNSNSLIANSYFDSDSYARGDLSLSIGEANDSSNLVLNNILVHGLPYEMEGDSDAGIFAYNLSAQTHTLYYENNPFNHVGGCSMELWEGNE